MSEQIKCTVNGMPRRNAICGHAKVGMKYCGLKQGECSLQEGVPARCADGVQVDATLPKKEGE